MPTLTDQFMLDLMGKLVIVRTELTRMYRDKEFSWEEVKAKPRGAVARANAWEPVGWVVGFRWLRRGKVRQGTQPHWGIDAYDAGEPSTFKETGKRIPCLLVAYWPSMKPVKVPLHGYELKWQGNLLSHPVAPSCKMTWLDRDRETCREIAAEQPRDYRGRFVSIK
jgi:hypothetical protein